MQLRVGARMTVMCVAWRRAAAINADRLVCGARPWRHAGPIQHDSDCQYGVKYKRKNGKRHRRVLHLASIDRAIPVRSGEKSLGTYRSENTRGSTERTWRNCMWITLVTVWFSLSSEASSEYASAGNGYNYNQANVWPPDFPLNDETQLNGCDPLTSPRVYIKQSHLFNLCLSFAAWQQVSLKWPKRLWWWESLLGCLASVQLNDPDP